MFPYEIIYVTNNNFINDTIGRKRYKLPKIYRYMYSMQHFVIYFFIFIVSSDSPFKMLKAFHLKRNGCLQCRKLHDGNDVAVIELYIAKKEVEIRQ